MLVCASLMSLSSIPSAVILTLTSMMALSVISMYSVAPLIWYGTTADVGGEGGGIMPPTLSPSHSGSAIFHSFTISLWKCYLPLSHHLTLGMLPPTLSCIHNITHMHTLPAFLRNITQPQMPILLRRSVLNYPIALVAHFIILCCGGLALVQLRAFREYDPSVTVVSHCCSCQQHRTPGHALGTRP